MTTAKQNCSICPSSIVEPCTFFCGIYPSSIVEGQHIHVPAGRRPNARTAEKKNVPTPTDKGTGTLTAVQSAALSQLCPHRKWYYSPRVPMNGGIVYGASHTPTVVPKKASTEFHRSLDPSSSHGGGRTKKTPHEKSNLQGALAQHLRVSELRCCNCGPWGSEGSSYVVDGQEQSRRLGFCKVTSTAENPAVYGMR